MPDPDDSLAQAQATPVVTGTGVSVTSFWLLSAFVLVLDQLTKALVLIELPLYASRSIIPGFLDLVHVQNRGVAFGILNDIDQPRSLITTSLALAALIGIGYYARHIHPHERLARLGLSLILGGAMGNLVDRLRHGFVVDFVDVYWRGWHFWAFNVADAAISVGAVLVFIELLFVSRHAPSSV